MTARRPLPTPSGPVFAALGIFGGLLIALGWYQAAGTVRFGDQVRSGALSSAGLAAVAVAVSLWTMAGRRAVETRLAELLRSTDELWPADATATGAGRAAIAPLVATESMALYHRPSCPMAAGKPVGAAGRARHEAAGRRPCGVCDP